MQVVYENFQSILIWIKTINSLKDKLNSLAVNSILLKGPATTSYLRRKIIEIKYIYL